MLAVLEAHGVRYVLIGGMAAVIHGADYVTSDIDVTPELGADNVGRLSDALAEMHARIRAVPEPLEFVHDAESLTRAATWNLTTDFGDLDITFTPSGTSGYRDLHADATTIEVLGVDVTLASLRDVIRSKEAAGRPKDLQALPALRRLLELDDDAQ
jgi:hypothetical protein